MLIIFSRDLVWDYWFEYAHDVWSCYAWFTNLKDLKKTCKVKLMNFHPRYQVLIYEFSNDLMIYIMIVKDSIFNWTIYINKNFILKCLEHVNCRLSLMNFYLKVFSVKNMSLFKSSNCYEKIFIWYWVYANAYKEIIFRWG
jgi:hypothetical protein